MAQAFARLGSAVTLISHDDQLLPTVDEDAAKHLLVAFKAKVSSFTCAARFRDVSQAEDGINIEIARRWEAYSRAGESSTYWRQDASRMLLAWALKRPALTTIDTEFPSMTIAARTSGTFSPAGM